MPRTTAKTADHHIQHWYSRLSRFAQKSSNTSTTTSTCPPARLRRFGQIRKRRCAMTPIFPCELTKNELRKTASRVYEKRIRNQ